MARSGADARARQQELVSTLHAAVETLTACVQRIEHMLHQVDGRVSDAGISPASDQRPQVSFGGGPSVIGLREPVVVPRREPAVPREERAGLRETFLGLRETPLASGDRRHGLERRGGEERRRAGERRKSRKGERLDPGVPALMAATELAHLGYSREQIAERLRERWGDRTAAILREALD